MKESEGTPEVSPRSGIGKPMLIVPRFYHIHRSGAKIVTASGHLEVKNCTEIYLPPGSAPDPAGGTYSILPDPLAGQKGLRATPKNHTLPRPLAHHLPSPGKILRAPMSLGVKIRPFH